MRITALEINYKDLFDLLVVYNEPVAGVAFFVLSESLPEAFEELVDQDELQFRDDLVLHRCVEQLLLFLHLRLVEFIPYDPKVLVRVLLDLLVEQLVELLLHILPELGVEMIAYQIIDHSLDSSSAGDFIVLLDLLLQSLLLVVGNRFQVGLESTGHLSFLREGELDFVVELVEVFDELLDDGVEVSHQGCRGLFDSSLVEFDSLFEFCHEIVSFDLGQLFNLVLHFDMQLFLQFFSFLLDDFLLITGCFLMIILVVELYPLFDPRTQLDETVPACVSWQLSIDLFVEGRHDLSFDQITFQVRQLCLLVWEIEVLVADNSVPSVLAQLRQIPNWEVVRDLLVVKDILGIIRIDEFLPQRVHILDEWLRLGCPVPS